MSIMNDLKKVLLDVNISLTELAEALSKKIRQKILYAKSIQ